MESNKAKLHKVCDYVIASLEDASIPLNILKLHKLLYYIQAWNLAFYDEEFFDEKFQAWINGPVSRTIYDRFAESKTMYSAVRATDQKADISYDLSEDDIQHIENVLETYGSFTEAQLVTLTHREEPWQQARVGYNPDQQCENIISSELMKNYYRTLI